MISRVSQSWAWMLFTLCCSCGICVVTAQAAEQAVDIGGRREVFLDRFLIAQMRGTELVKQTPRMELSDAPHPSWAYMTVLRDGDVFRLYGRTTKIPGGNWKTLGFEKGFLNEVTACAESRDGVRWTEPRLGVYNIPEVPAGNVILADEFMVTHNFTPLVDPRPGVPPGEKYKALGGHRITDAKLIAKYGPIGLRAYVSPDGLHWKRLRDASVLRPEWGTYDSQNLAFWSATEGRFVCYFRHIKQGLRSIRRSTSPDFVQWTEPVDIDINLPGEHLYTNNIAPYFRAPHVLVGMPTRFLPARRSATEVMLITSRDGVHFERQFHEPLLLPGPALPGLDTFGNRANYAAHHLVQTSPDEMSIYLGGGRRSVLRLDGLTAIHAPYAGGEMLTRPLVFAGRRLEINYATDAIGHLRVEVQDDAERPIPGFTLADCPMLRGNRICQVVAWTGGADVSQLAGKVVRLRFAMKCADLYALRFCESAPETCPQDGPDRSPGTQTRPAAAPPPAPAGAGAVTKLDSLRRALVCDETLVERRENLTLKIHRPREVNDAAPALEFISVLKPAWNRFQMYGRAPRPDGNGFVTLYAESSDGMAWREPDLGRHKLPGQKGNLLLADLPHGISGNFTPLVDARPGVAANRKYKALGGAGGLYALASTDGLAWELLSPHPVIRSDAAEAFDGMCPAYWDTSEQAYVCFIPERRAGVRTVSRCTSKDFVAWSAPEPLAVNLPDEDIFNLCLTAIAAPGASQGTTVALATRGARGTDGRGADVVVLLPCDGGRRFVRPTPEAWIRPGTSQADWSDWRRMVPSPIVTSAAKSPYASLTQDVLFMPGGRRCEMITGRLLALAAGASGGSLTTRPLVFPKGPPPLTAELWFDAAMAASGGLHMELLDAEGRPIPGYTRQDANGGKPVTLDGAATVAWRAGTPTLAPGDAAELAGKPVRIRFTLESAELYTVWCAHLRVPKR